MYEAILRTKFQRSSNLLSDNLMQQLDLSKQEINEESWNHHLLHIRPLVRSSGDMAFYFNLYLDMVDLLFNIIYFQRSGNWRFYLQAIAEFLPICFSLNRHNLPGETAGIVFDNYVNEGMYFHTKKVYLVKQLVSSLTIMWMKECIFMQRRFTWWNSWYRLWQLCEWRNVFSYKEGLPGETAGIVFDNYVNEGMYFHTKKVYLVKQLVSSLTIMWMKECIFIQRRFTWWNSWYRLWQLCEWKNVFSYKEGLPGETARIVFDNYVNESTLSLTKGRNEPGIERKISNLKQVLPKPKEWQDFLSNKSNKYFAAFLLTFSPAKKLIQIRISTSRKEKSQTLKYHERKKVLHEKFKWKSCRNFIIVF